MVAVLLLTLMSLGAGDPAQADHEYLTYHNGIRATAECDPNLFLPWSPALTKVADHPPANALASGPPLSERPAPFFLVLRYATPPDARDPLGVRAAMEADKRQKETDRELAAAIRRLREAGYTVIGPAGRPLNWPVPHDVYPEDFEAAGRFPGDNIQLLVIRRVVGGDPGYVLSLIHI